MYEARKGVDQRRLHGMAARKHRKTHLFFVTSQTFTTVHLDCCFMVNRSEHP